MGATWVLERTVWCRQVERVELKVQTCVRAEQPSRERTRRKGRLSAMLVMPVQPFMVRCSSRVNVSRATACRNTTGLKSLHLCRLHRGARSPPHARIMHVLSVLT